MAMKFKTEDVLIRLKKLSTTAFTDTITDSYKNRNQSNSNVVGNFRKFAIFHQQFNRTSYMDIVRSSFGCRQKPQTKIGSSLKIKLILCLRQKKNFRFR